MAIMNIGKSISTKYGMPFAEAIKTAGMGKLADVSALTPDTTVYSSYNEYPNTREAQAAQKDIVDKQTGGGGGGGIDYNTYLSEAAAAKAAQDAQLSQLYGGIAGRAKSAYEEAGKLRQAEYESGANALEADTARALQEAYINSMLQEKNIGQQLSAMGYSGGAAESTLMGLKNAYGKERGLQEQAKTKGLSSLLSTLNQAKAQDAANYYNQLNDYALSQIERQSALDENYNKALQDALAEYQARQLAAQKTSLTDEEAYALALANQGY